MPQEGAYMLADRNVHASPMDLRNEEKKDVLQFWEFSDDYMDQPTINGGPPNAAPVDTAMLVYGIYHGV